MNTISLLESNGDYFRQNGQYWGKYQMGDIARKEVGLSGMSRDKFLNNQYLQDWAVNEYMKITYKYLESTIIKYKIPKYGGIRIGNHIVTVSGLIAAAHLVGYLPVKYYVESGGKDLIKDGKNLSIDGKGVHLTKYFELNNIDIKLSK